MTISMIYRPNKTTSIYIRMTMKTIPLHGLRRRRQRPRQRFASLFSIFLNHGFISIFLRFLGCHNSISKIDLMYYIVQSNLVVSFLFSPSSRFLFAAWTFFLLKTQTTANLTDESSFVLQESGKLLVKPYIEELPELFVSYFKEILRVGYQIPRLEYYMSNGENVCKCVCT